MFAFLLVENIAVRPVQSAETWVINLYTHSERGALVWTASNFARTRLLIRTSILRPPWIPGIPMVTIAPSSVAVHRKWIN